MELPRHGTDDQPSNQQSNPILARLETRRTEYLLKKKEAADLNLSENEAEEEELDAKFPVKAKFRMRAHVNPLGDTPWPL